MDALSINCMIEQQFDMRSIRMQRPIFSFQKSSLMLAAAGPADNDFPLICIRHHVKLSLLKLEYILYRLTILNGTNQTNSHMVFFTPTASITKNVVIDKYFEAHDF